MRHGYLKLSRKLFDGADPFWQEARTFSRFEAWIDLLQRAAWRATVYSTAHGDDPLERGELVVSLRYLGERWGWGKNAVSRFLEKLEKAGHLTRQREGHHGTVYLIAKYAAYQSERTEGGTVDGTQDGTDAGHPRDTRGTKKKKVKQLSSKENTTAADAAADRVLAHFVARHPMRRPGPKDRALVVRALARWQEGELCEAIDGNAGDPWHQERRKHELAYVLRDDGKIGEFRDRYAALADASLAGKPAFEADGVTPTKWGRIALGLERAS